jgi:hypothetical protein
MIHTTKQRNNAVGMLAPMAQRSIGLALRAGSARTSFHCFIV